MLDPNLRVVPVANKRALMTWGDGGIPEDKLREIAPNAERAILTGAVNDIVVLDGDGKEGIDNLYALFAEHDDDSLLHMLSATTPSGGAHYYFRHPGKHIHVPCTVGRLAPNADTRGDGGYVCAPPAPGRAWINEQAQPSPLSSWLLDAIRTKPAAQHARELNARLSFESVTDLPVVEHENEGAMAVREMGLRLIKWATVGERNHTLNRVAFRLGYQIERRELDVQTTVDALYEAALDAGLDDWEIERTIESGIAAGAGL